MQKAVGNDDGSEDDSRQKNGNDGRSKAQWISAIKAMLGAVTHKRIKANSISIIPEKLRKSNVEAYKPKVVSIGPLHRGTSRDLLYMEEIKWQSMLSLLSRVEPKSESKSESKSKSESSPPLTRCSEAILKLDDAVRATYMECIEVNSYELAKIILLDACFLLELLISKPATRRDEKDAFKSWENKHTPGQPPGWELLEKQLKKGDVLSDLKLLENQIPLFIIDLLFKKLFGEQRTEDEVPVPIPIQTSDIINGYALFLLGCSSSRRPVPSPKIANFLELTHWFLTREEDEEGKPEDEEGKPEAVGVTIESLDLETEEQSMVIRLEESDYNDPAASCDKKLSKETKPKLERCAARLQAAGIEITPFKQHRGSSAKTLEESKHVMFGCKKKFERRRRQLEIQPLHVIEKTEVQWRNLIAFEQTRTTNKKFSEYALLFKGLVCCEHDIELLKTKQVLRVYDTKKWSNEKLKKFVHDIADGIQIDAKEDVKFCEMIKELNEYKSPTGNHRIFMLRHHCRRFLTNTRYTFRYLYRILKRDHASTPWKMLGVIAAVFLLLLTVAQTVLAVIGL